MSPGRAAATCTRLELERHSHPGALVTFCGVDGSGKSSLIRAIHGLCEDRGIACLTTATPTRRIRDDAVFRELVDDPLNTSASRDARATNPKRIDVLGLLLSIMGDLVQHISDTITPALERGTLVLCDRYIFTSHAELVARSSFEETQPILAAIASKVVQPDLAFGLNVSLGTSRRRVLERNDESDQPAPLQFLERQIDAYRSVIDANRLIALDTERSLEENLAIAMRHVDRRCASREYSPPRSPRPGAPRSSLP